MACKTKERKSWNLSLSKLSIGLSHDKSAYKEWTTLPISNVKKSFVVQSHRRQCQCIAINEGSVIFIWYLNLPLLLKSERKPFYMIVVAIVHSLNISLYGWENDWKFFWRCSPIFICLFFHSNSTKWSCFLVMKNQLVMLVIDHALALF